MTNFTYDLASRLTQLITPSGQSINLSYDPSGKPKQTLFPNDVVSDYQYDPRGRLASLSHTGAGDATLASFDYTYDPVGNILSIAEPARILEFTYDALWQVTTGGTATSPETYGYDALGNRTKSSLSATHVYDNANRLLEDDDFTYTYDASGNLATKTAKGNGALTAYIFDTQYRLVQIAFPDETMASYRYDVLGRRIEKNVNGVITRYVYDGYDIVLEYDGSNTLAARYSHGDRIDQPLSMERGGDSYFYHTDHLRSVRTLTDASGVVVNSYDYDTYGRVESVIEGVTNPFTYTGRERDPESGLYFYRARYYDPETGRFINQDPIGFLSRDPNLFRYVKGNPVNFNDPLGLISWDDILTGAGALLTIAGGITVFVATTATVTTVGSAISIGGVLVLGFQGLTWGARQIAAAAEIENAKIEASYQKKLRLLIKMGQGLGPCKLKRAIKEYTKLLRDSINYKDLHRRRSINPWDMEDIDELLRTGSLSERALRQQRGRDAELRIITGSNP